MRKLFPLWSAILLALAGCDAGTSDFAISVSLIDDGHSASGIPPAIVSATNGGLVKLDREGQIVPGAAARWAILDDGLDYIFRIDDGGNLAAATVATRLRAALRRAAKNPNFTLLATIESVDAVTKRVIEIRLSAPQPDLLIALASPELAVGFRTDLQHGETTSTETMLRPRSGNQSPLPLLVRSERVGRAITRFKRGDTPLVLGGTFADLPVAKAARLPRNALHFDPASGLFGFAVRNPRLDAAVRTALSLAIDRDRIVAQLGGERQLKATTIAGSTLEPPLTQRRNAARTLLAARPLRVRVAMPRGPGAQILFAWVAQDWRKIGIAAERVAPDAPADLALIDHVAPSGALAQLACAFSAGCDPRDRLALINPPFIPISTPIRWSLVAPSLDLFIENRLAAHPLGQLRSTR